FCAKASNFSTCISCLLDVFL
ncbi:putative cyclic nucleotide binding domain protein, partial [Vibrio parahaemolyticus EKP-028]